MTKRLLAMAALTLLAAGALTGVTGASSHGSKSSAVSGGKLGVRNGVIYGCMEKRPPAQSHSVPRPSADRWRNGNVRRLRCRGRDGRRVHPQGDLSRSLHHNRDARDVLPGFAVGALRGPGRSPKGGNISTTRVPPTFGSTAQRRAVGTSATSPAVRWNRWGRA